MCPTVTEVTLQNQSVFVPKDTQFFPGAGGRFHPRLCRSTLKRFGGRDKCSVALKAKESPCSGGQGREKGLVGSQAEGQREPSRCTSVSFI